MLRVNEIEQIEKYFKQYQSENAFYHNWNHVRSVVERSKEIAESFESVTEEDLKLLEIASYFHDIGYNASNSDDQMNIDRAIELFERYDEIDLSEKESSVVKSLIQATKFPHDFYEDLICQIIQDADLTQSWSDDQQVINANLANEGKNFSSEEFPSIEMLNTEYAKEKCRSLRSLKTQS